MLKKTLEKYIDYKDSKESNNCSYKLTSEILADKAGDFTTLFIKIIPATDNSLELEYTEKAEIYIPLNIGKKNTINVFLKREYLDNREPENTLVSSTLSSNYEYLDMVMVALSKPIKINSNFTVQLSSEDINCIIDLVRDIYVESVGEWDSKLRQLENIMNGKPKLDEIRKSMSV